LFDIEAPSLCQDSKSSWQTDWEDGTGGDKEGQLVVYIGGYGAIIDSGVFQRLTQDQDYPHHWRGNRSHAAYFSGAGAPKNSADVNGGGNSLHQVFIPER
jgi:hypothetical protein